MRRLAKKLVSDNRVNCWNTLTFQARAISSQAAEGNGSAEGSTTRRVSPNNNPAHERPAADNQRLKIWSELHGDMQNQGINSLGITRLTSVPFTAKMAELSMLNVETPVMKKLKVDATKVLDKLAEAALDTTDYRYYASSATAGTFTTSGTAGGTAAANFNAFHLKEMVDKLKALNCPTISGYYMGICSIKAARGLYDALEDIWKCVLPNFFARLFPRVASAVA